MENYSHFIITRFNLNLYAQDKHDLPTRTDRWLEHRFEVFERYCLPSVAAQTSGNFTWLCLFDAATPEPYRSRIEVLMLLRNETFYFRREDPQAIRVSLL